MPAAPNHNESREHGGAPSIAALVPRRATFRLVDRFGSRALGFGGCMPLGFEGEKCSIRVSGWQGRDCGGRDGRQGERGGAGFGALP